MNFDNTSTDNFEIIISSKSTINKLQKLLDKLDALSEILDKSSETKNSDREFEEIIAKYVPDDICTYPEYRGKPYYEIKYKENGKSYVGYSTYKPEVLSRYIKEYFMQEPKTDYKSFCEWVASEIFSDNWEYNKDGFEEIACRKLNKLGIVASEGDAWKLKESEEL